MSILYTTLRPVSDYILGNWYTQPTLGLDHYSVLDEVVADDTDFLRYDSAEYTEYLDLTTFTNPSNRPLSCSVKTYVRLRGNVNIIQFSLWAIGRPNPFSTFNFGPTGGMPSGSFTAYNHTVDFDWYNQHPNWIQYNGPVGGHDISHIYVELRYEALADTGPSVQIF